jgi:hypothetical protein
MNDDEDDDDDLGIVYVCDCPRVRVCGCGVIRGREELENGDPFVVDSIFLLSLLLARTCRLYSFEYCMRRRGNSKE